MSATHLGIAVALAVVAAIGIWLAASSRGLRRALAAYVGERPARWALGLAWAAYVYSALSALSAAFLAGWPRGLGAFGPSTEGVAAAPPALASVYYGFVAPLLEFFHAAAFLLQLGLIAFAAVVLQRYVNRNERTPRRVRRP